MKMKTAWDLKLLYKSDSDPQIKKDLKKITDLCMAFEKKYKGKAFTVSPQVLAKALNDYEKLHVEIGGRKPWWYFTLKADLNSSDTNAVAQATKCEQIITEASNKKKFFFLEVAKIPASKQGAFLKHPSLAAFRYQLEQVFKHAKYNLSEGEEQLEDLLGQTSYTMWVDGQQKLLNQQTIEFKGKKMPVPEALGIGASLEKNDRHALHAKLMTMLKSISHGAEGELNAIVNFKKVMDDRRGYAKPYSSTILGYENDEKAIESFIALVTKNFKMAHRFYALQARLFKEKKLSVADRDVQLGTIKTKFDFETSVSMLRTVLGTIDDEYVGFLDTYLANGEIDVYPKKGKKAGAYCWGMPGLPTVLLLNHTDDIRSAETIAHEMGHAIHTEMSKRQPSQYRHYTTSTAEVASTFFEQTIEDEIKKRLTDREKIILLHNKIKGDITTIFRQVACFNFETELHNTIRKEGQVSKEKMAEMMRKHLQSYLGDAVDVTADDGYFFVFWPHIRTFFYVYSYAYAQLISKALYEKWRKDPAYAKKVKQFLLAGRSMSPEDIFKSIGIDTSKTSFFEAGLKGIERDIATLEKLTKNFKK
ncbi:MAG: M3 family metallopeptidase [bacterium]